jgi:2,4-dienoyl-CoA reductase-like NADH-dependent reductase (Old Yellow Enzyme family)
MPLLFEATRLGSLTMANRFVRSATWEGLAHDDGFVTPRLIDVAQGLARGGVGLIISGHAYVSIEGQAGRWQLAAYSDDFIPGLSELTGSVHDLGGKIALQLAHAGTYGRADITGLQAMGPSPFASEAERPGKEMTIDDIEAVTDAFAAAAVRARTAGFDGVQIHAAHGYLLSQFLSPYFNKRKDAYGGNIENRAQFLLKVVRAIRRAVPADYPVLVKINAQDFLQGGLTIEEMVQTGLMLEEDGVSAVELSGGTFLSGKNAPSRKGKPHPGEPEAYYEEEAKQYKGMVGLPLMLVGGIRTIETAERLVGEGITDYISLCRPLIREPGLVNRWVSEDRKPARCISDSGCFTPGFRGRGVYCVVEARTKDKENV